MSYLEEFQTVISNRDFSKFLQLWEEYCTSDSVDFDEFRQLLLSIKGSELARQFGQIAETALPLWETLKDKNEAYEILRLLVDLQTSNTPALAEASLKMLKEKYGSQPTFNERLRLIGLRGKESFQGALSNYDLLDHVKVGKFVFHLGGWGTGEIMDVSPVREQLSIEFENVAGRKHLSFNNAFKTLIPLKDENFLARRFSDPDKLEKEAHENPVKILKLLLEDLGPKTAAEIKDELCGLVIQEKDWTKWWQGARAKIKKDTMVETPAALKDPFRLRKVEVTHEERLHEAIESKAHIDGVIQTAYSFVRDHPNMLKKPEIKNNLREKLMQGLDDQDLTKAQELQILIFFESQFGEKVDGHSAERLITKLDNIEEVIDSIEILAFKKKVMVLVKNHHPDWIKIFLNLLWHISQSPLKDYLIKELNQGEAKKYLQKKLDELRQNPLSSPEMFVWYFQKITSKGSEGLPYSTKEGRCQLFEAFLILYSLLDSKPEYKDLSKKMYNILSGKRYQIVRQIIEGTSIEFIKEFLLLVAKCQSLGDHDTKILRSLAEVVHPSLNPGKHRKEKEQAEANVLWITENGFNKARERIAQINNVEIVENAREIEAARALGDLRENSEYKFALEKRSRLQSEMKRLSDELGRSKIITKDDINEEEVGVGSIVEVVDAKGKKYTYTVLGPWDADPDAGILSYQSKLVQAMIGCRPGDDFSFKDEKYQVVDVKSYLDK